MVCVIEGMRSLTGYRFIISSERVEGCCLVGLVVKASASGAEDP